MPTWLVTGTSRGIGLETARQLAANASNTVFATCRSPSTADALKQLEAAHNNLRVLALDVTNEESIRAAVAAVGETPIDYLINNAGVGSEETIVNATPAEMERQFRTHVVGPLLVFRAFLPRVEAGSRKVVVNVTSGLASIGLDIGPKNASYSIAKAGMNMLTYKMARQYPHLTIFVMDPGWVKTEMGGPGAMIEVDFAVGKHIELYESATLEKHAGRFWGHDGKELPW